MPPKKKEKKKTEEEIESTTISDTNEDNTPLSLPEDNTDTWVTLDLRLLNWSYMNFKLKVRTSTKVFSIRKKIEERHGRITSLKVCKEQFAEKNEMTDEMRTLDSYGIKGASANSVESVVIMYYDFKPCDHSDPLLLAS